MEINPKLEHREKQHYLAIEADVKIADIPDALPPLISEVATWMDIRGIKPDGPAFFHYLETEGANVKVEVGHPVHSPVQGDKRIRPGHFPEGKYIVTTYVGHYSNLYNVHVALEKWGKKNGIKPEGPMTEFYPTDPDTEPDPDKWQTDIVVKVPDNTDLSIVENNKIMVNL